MTTPPIGGCVVCKPRRRFKRTAHPSNFHLVADPVASARAAGLRYVRDDQPGIGLKRSGKHFRYIRADGKTVCDPQELRRIRSLAIPPAWTQVWICPIRSGHLQATGRDSKGRKQYRYHLPGPSFRP